LNSGGLGFFSINAQISQGQLSLNFPGRFYGHLLIFADLLGLPVTLVVNKYPQMLLLNSGMQLSLHHNLGLKPSGI
jgi:hypothetical protein